MGELCDQWATDGKKNVFGNVMSITEMESETGAAGEPPPAAAGMCTRTGKLIGSSCNTKPRRHISSSAVHHA